MSSTLHGHSILVVEDEPLIALDITQALETAGAAVTTTNTLKHALILVEHDGLSGAILDHALGDGDSASLCSRLKERGIPFMIYSGYKTVGGVCGNALHLEKPATEGQLVTAMAGLISHFGLDPMTAPSTSPKTCQVAAARETGKACLICHPGRAREPRDDPGSSACSLNTEYSTNLMLGPG